MARRHGIIYGTQLLLQRVWAHRDGRLLLIGLPLFVMPDFAVRAMYKNILSLPMPTRNQVWRAVWQHSYYYEWPALAMMGTGALLVGFVCLRFLSDRFGTNRSPG